MAHIVQAVRKYGPRLPYRGTVDMNTLAEWMSDTTGFARPDLVGIITVLHEAILRYNQEGYAVKLPDIGTFSPSIDRHGNVRINFRPDVRLKHQIKFYEGEIRNKRRIGWSNEEYKEFWDEQHPDDPLEV